jgi:hypothetical protein
MLTTTFARAISTPSKPPMAPAPKMHTFKPSPARRLGAMTFFVHGIPRTKNQQVIGEAPPGRL